MRNIVMIYTESLKSQYFYTYKTIQETEKTPDLCNSNKEITPCYKTDLLTFKLILL